jgi:hypothetical protein
VHGFLAIALVAPCSVLFVTTSGATSRAGRALNAYFRQVNKDLQSCVVGIGTTQIELSLTLKSSTESNLINLYRAASKAEGPCDIVQNNNLLNLGTLNPPSGYPSLKNYSIEIQIWADSTSVTVLKDVEKVANDPSSTAAISNLLVASQTADANARELNHLAGEAAKKVSIKNTGGDMLIYWDLSEK